MRSTVTLRSISATPASIVNTAATAVDVPTLGERNKLDAELRKSVSYLRRWESEMDHAEAIFAMTSTRSPSSQ